MIGRTVGKYRIVDRLGRGGMGTVYRAVDETLDREVAIKVLNPDLGDLEVLKRFRAEAVALARLNHPGIATIYELYRQDDDLLMVMEFVRGETLQALSERLGVLQPPQAVHICLQILDALGHAHRAGVVHRDLKPANVMVTEAELVKVMDFGIARVLGTEHFTHGGYMMGTPAYMAPEQVLGREVDGRADLYSVGVVLYRLLSRELPFKADTAIAMVQKQVGDLPTPLRTFRPELPAWCGLVIDRALAKRPEDRYQSADEFRKALLAAVRPQALGEMPTMLTPTPLGLPIDPELTRTYGTGSPPALPPEDTDGGGRRAAVGSAIHSTKPEASGATAREAAVERTATTVVLGRTHLVTLAALVLVLAAGVIVLAFLAFRRADTAQAQLPAAAAETSPGQAAAATAAGDDTVAVDPTVQPPVIEPPPPPAPTPAAQATRPARRDASAAARSEAAATPSPSSGNGGTAARGTSTAAPEPPADPPAPAPAPEFVVARGVRVLLSQGDSLREREVFFQMNGQVLSLRDGPEGPEILSLPYAGIVSAFYSRGNHPRWRAGDGTEVESRVDRGRLGFFRGERNWLVISTTGSDPVIIRLDDNVMRTTLAQFQQLSGVTIQR